MFSQSADQVIASKKPSRSTCPCRPWEMSLQLSRRCVLMRVQDATYGESCHAKHLPGRKVCALQEQPLDKAAPSNIRIHDLLLLPHPPPRTSPLPSLLLCTPPPPLLTSVLYPLPSVLLLASPSPTKTPQDGIGGNAKTLMFVNISPSDYNSE
eukprot:765371-Hanusia_phi.AAC.1